MNGLVKDRSSTTVDIHWGRYDAIGSIGPTRSVWERWENGVVVWFEGK
jgi:hypothetical protein